jgi:hypothetical protein
MLAFIAYSQYVAISPKFEINILSSVLILIELQLNNIFKNKYIA